MKKLYNIFLVLAITGIVSIRFIFAMEDSVNQSKIANNLFVDGVVSAELKGRTCVLNKNGEIIAELKNPNPNYNYGSSLGRFTPDGIAVYYTDFYWHPSEVGMYMQGYVNTKGEIIVPPDFTYAEDFNNGLAVVVSDKGAGIINTDGEYVIDPRFNSIKSFENDKYAPAKQGEKWGYINKKGDFVIAPQFDDARSFGGGKYAVVMFYGDPVRKIDYKYGIIDRNGNFIVEPEYSSIKKPYGDITIIDEREVLKSTRIVHHYSLLNIKTGEKIPIDYENIGEFDENGLALVYRFAKWGYINTKGEEIIPLKYRKIKAFENGLAVVQTKDKTWGYINTKGEMIMEFDEFDDLGHMHNGMAWFRIGEKIGYINEQGEVVIEPKLSWFLVNNMFEGRDFCDDGYTVVIVETQDTNDPHKQGVIDKQGNFIIEPIYDWIR